MKKNIFLFVVVVAFSLPTISQTGIIPKLGKDPVKKVIAAMTLEEKASFVVGTGMRMPGAPPAVNAAINTQNSPVVGQTQDLVAGAAGTTYSIPRLGIPAMVVADGPAGLRISPTRENDKETYYCTAFPVGTLLASTWDTELVNKIGQAIGNEVLEYGVDVLLGPGMNIHRNPLCGRNFEYYSEDPLITGKMAAAMINGVESQGVGTSIKHFAANNTETNRNSLNTVVSERALREIYLKGFGIAVEEAQPWTVMSSYNLINNVYSPENPDLLTKVLRNDWGFNGFVMTDWFGGKNPAAMMIAGNDLLMPGTPAQAKAIVTAVKDGKLNIKILDRNVEKILNILLQTPRFKGYKYSNKPDLKAHAQVTRQVATEGMILLKNDNSALPFSQNIKKISVFGNTSFEIITGGTGSGDVNEAYSVSLIEGLQNAGYNVNENIQKMYLAYLNAAREGKQRSRGFMMGSTPVAELAVNDDLAGSMANICDAAIITIGRNSGEFYDRKEDGDLNLTQAEKDMIKTVSDAFHAKKKKAIVVLNIGSVIETESWKNIPDAILLAWQAGQEAGNSIADVLSGKVNPSGKLASTFPVNYKDVPSAKNFPGIVIDATQSKANAVDDGPLSAFLSPKASKIVYEEGIYVGYRYYSTFNIPVSYEFGYGLSYTSFEYSNLKMSSSKFSGRILMTVDIKNTGNAAGKEIVQLYLSAPSKKLDKPALELKGFAKTLLLQPGESQTLTFVIDSHSLSSFDPASSSWIAEAGKYEVLIGSSSKDIRQNASFTLAKDLTVKKESASLLPKEKINELKAGK